MPAQAGRRAAALGVSVAALLTVPTLPAAEARVACSCAVPGEPGKAKQARFEQSDVVFTGKVLKERVHRVASYSPDGLGVSYSGYVTYLIKPDRAYKGYVRSPQRVRAGGLGSSCEYRLRGEGPFLIFASRPPPSEAAKFKARGTRPPVHTGMCSGNHRVAPGEAQPFGPGRPVAD